MAPLVLLCLSPGLPAGFGPTALAAAVATAATVCASAARGLRARLVDGEAAAAELMLVEHRDRLLRILVGRHFDEREAARAARGHITHHVDAVDRARGREERAEVLVVGVVREVADVEFSCH